MTRLYDSDGNSYNVYGFVYRPAGGGCSAGVYAVTYTSGGMELVWAESLHS